MKLYTLGPVEMFPDIMDIGSNQIPYFRNDEFSNVMLHSISGLKRLLDAPNESEIAVLTGSGTAAMEATIINCFDGSDNLIIINGGTFGQRFVELCKLHKIPFTEILASAENLVTKERLDELKQSEKYTGLLVNIHESSTGMLYDLEMLSLFCRENNLFFVVDAISSFLADKLSMSEASIDAVILSSQKALSLAPGLSFVALSKKIIQEKVNRISSKIMYLDFKSHLENIKRGQTPFTPSVRIVFELKAMIDKIEKIGLDIYIDKTKEIALDFRNKISKLPISLASYPLSNASTPVFFPDKNAKSVYMKLIESYGFVVNPNGGKDGDSLFRVAHIGNHSINDNDLLVSAIKEILDEESN